jgi:pimeloyl-ACP methyl ester carboxylesterase
MTTFVLIHGSWQNGNAWDQTVQHLKHAGHTAWAPTIAGHGKGSNKAVNHAQATQSIVDYIQSKDLQDFVLVGHSFGGTIISKVAEVMPERIRRMVFWNAFVLRDGYCLNDEVPPHYRGLFGQIAQQSSDNTVMLPFPIWREAFINDADLDLAKSTYESLSPEPYQLFNDKLDLKKFYSLETPRSYLNCTEDIALPPGEWGWHPRMSSRLGLFRLVQMPGSHEVLFTNPKGLAEKLIEAGRD